MNITATDYHRCYPKRLKKIFQSNLNMQTYNSFIPNMERAIVGNIPPELIRMFPKETRGQDIKEFQKLLADITSYIRKSYKKQPFYIARPIANPFLIYSKYVIEFGEWQNNINKIFNDGLKKFTHTHLSGNLDYVNEGISGKIFKLTLTDKNGNEIFHSKALKVYHDIKNNDTRVSDDMHGSYPEANFWTYLKRAAGHSLDKTQFTKHYISDLHNGYTLTELIDKDITKTSAKIDFQTLFRIKFTDSHRNRPISKKLYDVGGFQKMSKFMDDKIVLRYFKKLFFRSKKELPEVLARYEALAQNPKTPHRDKIQRAIKLFKKE